jgi:hypothetical protein
MALSGSVRTNPYVYKGTDSYGNAITGQVGLECRWTATQDIAANKSIISWTLISYGDDFTFVTGNVKLDINNARVLQIDSRFDLRGAGYWSRTGTLEVLHEADGSKDFTISISAGIWYYTSSNCTGTDTFTLDSIGRSSSATVPNFTIGTSGNIAISRANNSFTHRLSVKLGGSVIEIASGVGTSYQWTPDANTWGKLIPNATSAACTMVLETYNGSTKIGDSKSYPFTLYVPASYVPSVTSLAVSLVNDNATVKSWGVAVKGFTKLSWSAQAAGSYGSTITKYEFAVGGQTGNASTGTTGILLTAGNITPTVKVTDSRGRTSSKNAAAITVYDYASPTISNASAYRCDANGNANESGTNVRLTLTAHISSVGGKNSAKLQYRYRQAGGNFGSWTNFTSGAILTGFDVANSYEFELRAIDALNNAKSATFTVSTESVWLNGKDGGKGAAFGKYAEEDDLFDVAWRSRFRGAVTFDTRPAQLAPSGFGLGEKAPKTPWANVDSLLLSGWYRFDETENPTPGGIAVGGITATYAYMRVDGYNENHCFQTLYPFGFNGSRLSRAMVNGVWEEWGWENPPMSPGVEYRTTERINLKPIYTKFIDLGNAANNAKIDISSFGAGWVVRYAGWTDSYSLPFIFNGSFSDVWTMYLDVTNTDITIKCGSSMAGRKVYCQIWYTKS